MSFTVVAHVMELAFIRMEDGKLYHWSLFRDKAGDLRSGLEGPEENEEAVLWGAAKHDWDMRPSPEFNTVEEWKAWRTEQAEEQLRQSENVKEYYRKQRGETT